MRQRSVRRGYPHAAASPSCPAAWAAPASSRDCCTASRAAAAGRRRRRRGHRRRQHRRRHLGARAQGLPRPRHRDVHPRRRHRPRARLGPPRRDLERQGRSSRRTAWSRPGSASATATSPPTWSAPRCSTPATRCRAVTEALCRRWLAPGPASVRLLPMTDDRVETHVADRRPRRAERAPGRALPGVLGAAARRGAGRGGASSVGARRGHARARRARGDHRRRPRRCCRRPTRWSRSARSSACPGVREALRATPAPGRRPLPDHRRRPRARHGRRSCSPRSASRSARPASALHYGARGAGGVLDGWLVDERRRRRRSPGCEARACACARRAADDDRPRRHRRDGRGRASTLVADDRRDAGSRCCAPDGVARGRPRATTSPRCSLAGAVDLADGDVVVVTSKVVSKAEGRVRRGRPRRGASPARPSGVVARRGPTDDRADPARAGHGRRRRRRLQRRGRARRAAARWTPTPRRGRCARRLRERTGAQRRRGRHRHRRPRLARGPDRHRDRRRRAARRSRTSPAAPTPTATRWRSPRPPSPTSWPAPPSWPRASSAGRPFAVVRGRADLVLPAGERRPGRRGAGPRRTAATCSGTAPARPSSRALARRPGRPAPVRRARPPPTSWRPRCATCSARRRAGRRRGRRRRARGGPTARAPWPSRAAGVRARLGGRRTDGPGERGPLRFRRSTP